MGDLCDQCAALCCRYFALPIDNPKSAKQYDDIRWYLVHENVVVFIEKKQWYLGILNRCKHLQSDNRCGIYHSRPHICRQYSTDNCDYHGGDYDYEELFTSAEQLRVYALEQLKKKKWRRPKGSTVLLPPVEEQLAKKASTKRSKSVNGQLNGKAKLNGRANGERVGLSVNGNGSENGGLVRNGRSISLPVIRRNRR